MKLPLWGNQNQATYFLKDRTLWNWWGSNMGIPIDMLLIVKVLLFFVIFKYFFTQYCNISYVRFHFSFINKIFEMIHNNDA